MRLTATQTTLTFELSVSTSIVSNNKGALLKSIQPVRLLTLDEVAIMLRKSPAQLRWLRHQGTGPKSAKLGGRVMYREQDVTEWINRAFGDAA